MSWLIIDNDVVLGDVMTELGNEYGQKIRYIHPDNYTLHNVRNESPELIILDYELGPTYSSLEICVEICANCVGSKVVFLSGYDYSSYKRNAINAGAIGYLTKPFEMGNLIRQIYRLLDSTSVPILPGSTRSIYC